KSVYFHVTDAIFQHLVRDWRNGYDIPSDHHLLRLRSARPDHGNIDGRAWSAAEGGANLRQRHIARALALDRFEDVGVLNASFLGRRSRQYRNHVRISKAFG